MAILIFQRPLITLSPVFFVIFSIFRDFDLPPYLFILVRVLLEAVSIRFPPLSRLDDWLTRTAPHFVFFSLLTLFGAFVFGFG